MFLALGDLLKKEKCKNLMQKQNNIRFSFQKRNLLTFYKNWHAFLSPQNEDSNATSSQNKDASCVFTKTEKHFASHWPNT